MNYAMIYFEIIKRSHMKLTTITVMSALLAAFIMTAVSCTQNGSEQSKKSSDSGEKEFKEEAAKYAEMLTAFEKVQPDIITDPEDVKAKLKERGFSDVEIEKRMKKNATFEDDFPVYVFYESKKDEWLKMAQWFSDFRKNHPDSMWSDDALFMLTLLPYMPGRETDTNAFITSALKEFATTDVHLSLEPWTMEKFKDLNAVRTISRDDISLLPPGLSFEEKCVALYTFSYAMITINEGNEGEGAKLLRRLMDRYKGSAMAKIATRVMDDMKGEKK